MTGLFLFITQEAHDALARWVEADGRHMRPGTPAGNGMVRVTVDRDVRDMLYLRAAELQLDISATIIRLASTIN